MRSNIGTAAARPGRLPGAAGGIPFNSLPLRRLLAGWAAEAATGKAAPAPPAPPDVAERLGSWLAWTDAVELSAALHQPPADAGRGAPASAPLAPLAQALARLQAEQARAIATDPVYLPGQGANMALDTDEAAPYRRAALARQRAMAAAIAPLRARLRAALAARSPALAALAALDATLEAALAGRERSLLAGVAGQIAWRFGARRAAGGADWRARFHHDMQQALLAELDLRLQPLHGLLDALRGEAPA